MKPVVIIQITGEDVLEAARQADCENFNSTERGIYREGFIAGIQHQAGKPLDGSGLRVLGLSVDQINVLKQTYEMTTGNSAEDIGRPAPKREDEG